MPLILKRGQTPLKPAMGLENEIGTPRIDCVNRRVKHCERKSGSCYSSSSNMDWFPDRSAMIKASWYLTTTFVTVKLVGFHGLVGGMIFNP